MFNFKILNILNNKKISPVLRFSVLEKNVLKDYFVSYLINNNILELAFFTNSAFGFKNNIFFKKEWYVYIYLLHAYFPKGIIHENVNLYYLDLFLLDIRSFLISVVVNDFELYTLNRLYDSFYLNYKTVNNFDVNANLADFFIKNNVFSIVNEDIYDSNYHDYYLYQYV